MTSDFHLPSESLRPFIDYYQIIEVKASAENPFQLKDYPRTAMDMVFRFQGAMIIKITEEHSFHLDKTAFIGHFDQPYEMELAEDCLFLHVRFKPNGIYPLTKIPLKKVLNNQIDINDLLNKNISDVYDRMSDQVSNLEKIVVLERYLHSIYKPENIHHRLNHGLALIDSRQGNIAVTEVCKRLNTNYKSLDRWFFKNIGLSPKKFIGITRFKHILADIESTPNPDWMTLVNKYGFHDQSHFIRTFKTFSGTSPSDFH